MLGRMEYDFTLASIFRQDVVPEAVKWYCDEGEEEEEDYDDDDEDDDEEDDDDDDDDDDDEDEEEVQVPTRAGRRNR